MNTFTPPIVFQDPEKPGIMHHVTAIEAAARHLIEWDKRGKKGRKLNRAIKVCTEALNGKGTEDKVRAAFVAAAREAGMWVKD